MDYMIITKKMYGNYRVRDKKRGKMLFIREYLQETRKMI